MTGKNTRYISKNIAADLKKKMVLIAGPRQVGKTTLALSFLKDSSEQSPAYLNWDYAEDRNKILAGELPGGEPLVIFDEVHKYHGWRNLIKGFYDKKRSKVKFIVTGSARLDYYSHGGDSMQGRYFPYRLHPFSLSEFDNKCSKNALEHLLIFGGFPEPLFDGTETFWKRWQREKSRLVFSEDLIDLEHVKDISKLKLLLGLLPSKVGSPLSITNLKSDLEVSYETVERWITIFENLFLCFRISPFGPPKIRAVKKEQKLYVWDWSLISDRAARFENLVACQLLKYCHFLQDTEGRAMSLRYLKDYTKREVDFVVMEDEKPLFAVECKLSAKTISQNIKFFSSRAGIPYYYEVHLGDENFDSTTYNASLIPFRKFVSRLSMP